MALIPVHFAHKQIAPSACRYQAHVVSTERLQTADLDLLVVLDALLDEEHVGRAAQRLGRTPSAVSRALGRLRDQFDDELLVRTGHGMRPTARAKALEGPLRRWLLDADRLLQPVQAFDPARAHRTFRVCSADYGALVVIEPLFHRLVREYPAIDVDLRPYDATTAQALVAGEIDIVIGPRRPSAAGVIWGELFDEVFVCVVWDEHPVRRLTLRRYLDLPHVLVAPTGKPGSLVDDALARRGEHRRVALRTPSFLGVPGALVGSSCITTLPRRIAEHLAEKHALRLLEPPIELPRFTMCYAWHEVHRSDPAHRWFRQCLSP